MPLYDAVVVKPDRLQELNDRPGMTATAKPGAGAMSCLVKPVTGVLLEGLMGSKGFVKLQGILGTPQRELERLINLQVSLESAQGGAGCSFVVRGSDGHAMVSPEVPQPMWLVGRLSASEIFVWSVMSFSNLGLTRRWQ